MNLPFSLFLAFKYLKPKRSFISAVTVISMLGVMLLFFSARMSEGVENYPLYLLIGIVHYTHFANSTSASMTVLQSLGGLTKNAIFPKEILVLGTVLSRSSRTRMSRVR